jgi:hypothetical protein
MRRSFARLFAVAAAMALGGCKFGVMNTAPSGAGGAGGVTGNGGNGGTLPPPPPPPPPPFDSGINLDSNGISTADLNCGAKDKAAAKLLPEILIVLDRSGSMNEDVSGGTCMDGGFAGGGANCGATSKWAQMTPALMQVVMETNADVNWGLKFFPDNQNNACNVNTTAAVPIAMNNATAITTAIMGATQTNGGVVGYNNTPTRSAENGATTYLKGRTTANPKYILLATDGLPNCADSGMGGRGGGGTSTDDPMGATMAIASALTAGYKTFVVGIATGGATADMTLSAMANAGGLPRSGTPSYYPVTTGQELADAIRTLIGVAATCTFQIGPPPTSDGTTSLGLINVFGDGVEITRDTSHANGYDYTDASMNSIEIHGPLCQKVMSGEIKEVKVTFRCLVP